MTSAFLQITCASILELIDHQNRLPAAIYFNHGNPCAMHIKNLAPDKNNIRARRYHAQHKYMHMINVDRAFVSKVRICIAA